MFCLVAECWGGDGEFGCEVASGGLLSLSCHIPQVFVLLLGFPHSRITFFGLGCRLWQWPGCGWGMCSCLLLLISFLLYLGFVRLLLNSSARWFHEFLELDGSWGESSVNQWSEGVVISKGSGWLCFCFSGWWLIVGGRFVEDYGDLSCQAFHHSRWWSAWFVTSWAPFFVCNKHKKGRGGLNCTF